MSKEIKFRKSRVFLAIILFVSIFAVSISLLLSPEQYLRNIYSKTVIHIQFIGIVVFIYSSAVLFSLIKISTRKYAIRMTDEFLIDHSRYESFGKIRWSDISDVQRFKKKNIEVILNTTDFKPEKGNLLKRFLRVMNDWEHDKRILISSALLDCRIEELFESISVGYENNK